MIPGRITDNPPAWLSGLNLVVGLGATGLSVARCLMALGCECLVVDDRPRPPGLEALSALSPGGEPPLRLGPFDPALFRRARRLIVSPGVGVATPAVAGAAAAGVPVWGDIELFARLYPGAAVAAVTGSNGKSTVASWLAEAARRAGVDVAAGGNLGPPALDLPEGAGLYVLELSSFQLETTETLAPRVAAVLNLSADHLDRYPDMAAYGAAKQRIFVHSAHCVINADDPAVAAMAAGRAAGEVSAFTLTGPPGGGVFGLRPGPGDEPWLARGDEPWLAARALALPGRHNLANALAVMALGQALGLPRAALTAALGDFRGLAHRTETVLEAGGVRWVDDSKGTNVGAAVAAVGGMGAPVVLIAGGVGKGQDFGPLGPLLRPDGPVRALVLIGRDAGDIAAVADPALPRARAADMGAAVRLAAGFARTGDCVLLSPACASFDMFDDYRARGRAFADAARSLAGAARQEEHRHTTGGRA